MVKTANIEAKKRNLELAIMFQDESRFGRMNDLKRCWCFLNKRPNISKQMVREYIYIYGAFNPVTGDCDMIILPSMSAEAMNCFLEILSKRHPDKLILLICDGASNHKESAITIPDNILVERIPPRSPQLNPSENMWEEIKEKFFYNEVFRSMEALIDNISKAILWYEGKRNIIKSITGWGWINEEITVGLKEN